MPKTVHDVPGYGTIHFPDEFTEQDIQRAIAEMPQNQRQSKRRPDDLYYPAHQIPVAPPNTLERLGRGAQDTLDRISQLWVAAGEKVGAYPEGLGDVMTHGMNKEQAEYRKHLPEGDVDVGRVLGNVGMTSPLILTPAGASYWGALGWGAGTGAASGFLQYDETNSLEGTLKNTGTGAVVGAAAGPLARAVSQGIKAFTQRGLGKFKGVMERMGGKADPQDIVREVPEFAELPPEMRATLILEAQKQISATGTLNVEQLARKANLIANDVTPTKSMVTRNPRDWSMERNMQKLAQSPDEQISGLGQELTNVYRANDAALSGRMRSFAQGLPQGTSEAHGMAIMQALDNLSSSSQKDVGALYKMVRETSGDMLASDAKALVSTLDDLKDNTYAEKLVSSVQNKLKRFGMLDKDGNLTANTLTVNQAEELRKFVNTLPNDFGKKDIIRAIDTDVLQGAGSDAFEAARGAAQKRFAMLENPVTQKALNAYGELTQGKTAQNFIKSQVIDAAEQDVTTLLNTLKNLPEKEAAQAVDSMKSGVLQYLESKAINPNSGQFSGAKLNDAIRQIGEGKLRKILGEQEFKQVSSLARAGLDATFEPAYASVNHSGTAPMLLSLTQKARAFPGVPLLVNKELENLAARSGYRKQLADTLAAGVENTMPQLSPRVRSLIDMIRGAGAPAAVVTADQIRDPRRKGAN